MRDGSPVAAGTPPDVDRYARQSRFWAIGAEGQARLAAGRVVVIGCGGLGSAVIGLLARAGVGHLRVVDRDRVELGNLHRQLLYDEADAAAGTPKAKASAAAVGRINALVVVEAIVAEVTAANVDSLVAGADVVIDGTDNLETRYLVNDACIAAGIPWVYGGAVGSTGMVMTILPGETACLRCMLPTPPPGGTVETAAMAGVLASSVVMVAALQWTEAVKLLLGDREHVNRGLVAFDAWTNDHVQSAGVPRRADCPSCGGRQAR